MKTRSGGPAKCCSCRSPPHFGNHFHQNELLHSGSSAPRTPISSGCVAAIQTVAWAVPGKAGLQTVAWRWDHWRTEAAKLEPFLRDETPMDHITENDTQAIAALRDVYARLRTELGRVIVGQENTIERLAICLFARGHALLMGVPGLAKTLLVRKLAETMSLKFSRIQFTPDLMPMDITGTDILQDTAGGRREFEFVHGPVFANLVLADEINRAPPRPRRPCSRQCRNKK